MDDDELLHRWQLRRCRHQVIEIVGQERWPRTSICGLRKHHVDVLGDDTLDGNLGLRRFTLGHEIGHWELHVRPTGGGQLAYIEGDRSWCRERSSNPLEIQAERFAAFLLTPTELLVPRLPPAPWGGWTPVRELAAYFGTSLTAMIVRLEKGAWAHRDANGYPRSGKPKVESPQLVLLPDE